MHRAKVRPAAGRQRRRLIRCYDIPTAEAFIAKIRDRGLWRQFPVDDLPPLG
jgi:hypothetical protein